MIESAIKAPFSLYKVITDDDAKPSKAVRDVATLISMTVGVPANAVARPVGYLADVSADKVDPTSQLVSIDCVLAFAFPSAKE